MTLMNTPKRGDFAHVPGSMSVTVANRNPIRSYNKSFPEGETGLLAFGGKAIVLSSHENFLLVEYEAPTGEERGGGSILPTGAQFIITVDSFYKMNHDFYVETERRKGRQKLLEILRRKERP